MNTELEILTLDEVADYLRVSRHRAYVLIRSGALESFRIGRSIRVRRTALEHFTTAAEAATASAAPSPLAWKEVI